MEITLKRPRMAETRPGRLFQMMQKAKREKTERIVLEHQTLMWRDQVKLVGVIIVLIGFSYILCGNYCYK